MNRFQKILQVLMVVLVVAPALPACAVRERAALHTMPLDQMPSEVQTAPASVRTAYQFAAANPDIMEQIPCYCGCGNIGHTSNYDCYVSGIDGDGNVVFDNHALGCSICVDITLDVMRLLENGKNQEEIRLYIDSTYSKFGPSNIP